MVCVVDVIVGVCSGAGVYAGVVVCCFSCFHGFTSIVGALFCCFNIFFII